MNTLGSISSIAQLKAKTFYILFGLFGVITAYLAVNLADGIAGPSWRSYSLLITIALLIFFSIPLGLNGIFIATVVVMWSVVQGLYSYYMPYHPIKFITRASPAAVAIVISTLMVGVRGFWKKREYPKYLGGLLCLTLIHYLIVQDPYDKLGYYFNDFFAVYLPLPLALLLVNYILKDQEVYRNSRKRLFATTTLFYLLSGVFLRFGIQYMEIIYLLELITFGTYFAVFFAIAATFSNLTLPIIPYLIGENKRERMLLFLIIAYGTSLFTFMTLWD